jgi:DNA-binding CsgD family transcriptional regulator
MTLLDVPGRDGALMALPLIEAALEVTLDAVGAPAWIEDRDGGVRMGNAAWRALVPSDAIGDPERFCIAAPGSPVHALVIARPCGTERARVLAPRAARVWGLTARQADVLRWLVLGEANKSIAVALGRALHTIELHVSEILQRTGCESRAQLVARFWCEDLSRR